MRLPLGDRYLSVLIAQRVVRSRRKQKVPGSNPTEVKNFYASTIKWLGHIVLPLSVLPDSVSAYFLCQTWRFSNEILYIAFHESTQVEFEFGSGRKKLGKIMPLVLRKTHLIFSFRSLSPYKLTF